MSLILQLQMISATKYYLQMNYNKSRFILSVFNENIIPFRNFASNFACVLINTNKPFKKSRVQ